MVYDFVKSSNYGIKALQINAYAAHCAEIMMQQRRQLRSRHKTFVSFAAKYHYVESQRRLAAAAGSSGDFDTIENWSPDRLRKEPIFQTHAHILTRSRGAGNWAWKPYIIARAMEERQDGDFIVFSDTGMQAVDNDPLPPISSLLTWLAGSERRVAVGLLHGRPQRLWTKRDCFVLMDCDEERYWMADQYQASYIAFMVGDVTRKLITEWECYARDERIITDIPNQMGLPNFDDFIDHRFDQSILSNLIYKLDLETPSQRETSKKIKTFVEELDRDIAVSVRPSENLALGRTWTASSSSAWSPRTGIYGQRLTGGLPFFFHTELEHRPWFKLDLGEVLCISEIRIYNRWDQLGERSQLMRVWLSSDNDDEFLVFDAVDAHWHPGTPLFLRLGSAKMRFLKIDLDEEQYLHLDGIEIFAATL